MLLAVAIKLSSAQYTQKISIYMYTCVSKVRQFFYFFPIYFIENKTYLKKVFCCYFLTDFEEIYID